MKTADAWLVGFRPEVRMLARVATFAQAPAPADAPAVNGLRDLVCDFDAVPEPIAGTCPCLHGLRLVPSRETVCLGRALVRVYSEQRALVSVAGYERLYLQEITERPGAPSTIVCASSWRPTSPLLSGAVRAAETRDTAVATLEQPVSRAAHHASRSGKRKASLPPAPQ